MNSKKVFIVHGFGGLPNGGWFPWIMKELAKYKIPASAPLLPDTKNPNVVEWIKTIQATIGEPSEDIIIVGHSLGVPAVLRYLESFKEGQKIGGVVLVSGFIEPFEVNDPQSVFRKIDLFVTPAINFSKIKNKAIAFTVVHGVKDAIVPFLCAENISQELNCKLVSVPKGDHFSQLTEPICYELPEVLEEILKMINK